MTGQGCRTENNAGAVRAKRLSRASHLAARALQAKYWPAKPPAPIIVTEGAVPFASLAWNACHFPLSGSGAAMLCCGAAGAPYCEVHRERCYYPAPASKV